MTERSGGKHRLGTVGISYVNRMVGTTFAPASAFFVVAWRVDIIQAWVYFGLFVLLALSNIALLAMHDMQLLEERGKTQADVHGADRVIAPLYLLLTHVIAPAVAGLIENWARYVNHFYERSIRLRTDRRQTVVTSGPYSVVRHPGYLSYILRFAALPLALGSVYATIPVVAGIVVLAVRTSVEDALLLGNLPGYKEHAGKVKYRLIPLLW